MLKKYIEKILGKKNLSREEAKEAIISILNSESICQSASFLSLLKYKGETADEVLGFLDLLEEYSRRLKVEKPILDIVGTGGDNSKSINISTAASLIVASCGVNLVKHGNRSVSSACGSADLLEKFGINIECSPEKTLKCLNKTGFGFCYAPLYNPAFNKLKKMRKDLGISTIFNILGPLLNPAKPDYMMIGTFNRQVAEVIANTLTKKENIKRAILFNSSGLDELNCIAPCEIIDVKCGSLDRYILDARDYGFSACTIEDLRGGTPEENQKILKHVFDGNDSIISENIIFNAAVGLFIVEKVKSIDEGVSMAKESIKEKKVTNLIEMLIKITNESEF